MRISILILRCLVMLTFFALSSAASAALCPGKLIDAKNAVKDGVVVGHLYLYYDNWTGDNCAVFTHSDATWGDVHLTSVQLYKCPTNDPASCSQLKGPTRIQTGDYKYYAGPISVYGKNRCVSAAGFIAYGSKAYSAVSGTHCD